MSKNPEIIEDLVSEELIGIHAVNPFVGNNSSSRSYMSSLHLSQLVTIEDGDEKIIQTGIEYQLGENTFSKKIENDSRVINIVKRYDGVSANYATEVTAIVIIFEDLVTEEIDFIEIPYYFSLHQYFGFKYVWNMDIINSLNVNTIIPAGTILADSPTVCENSGYKFGLNANLAYLSLPEVSEDGVIISEEMAQRMSYKTYERVTVEFGSESFPLNIYGTADNYKSFPDIGEYVNEDNVIMVLRDYDPSLTPALNSKYDVMDFNPIFDKAYYVKAGSKVVDIKVYHSPMFKKDVYSGTSDNVVKYHNGFKKYNEELVKTYEKVEREHYSRQRGGKVRLSEKFHRMLVDAYVLSDKKHNIKFTHKKQKLDIYRVEFVLEKVVVPGVGAKVTTISGSKGVVVQIRPKHEMPIDPTTGDYIDIIMDPTSIPGRMNIGNLYEQYFNAISRKTKQLVKTAIGNTGRTLGELSYVEVNNIFGIILGITEIIGTEQHEGYLNTSVTERRVILKEVIEKEFFIYYTVSSAKRPNVIIAEVQGTIYEPYKGKISWWKDGKEKITKDDMIVGPQYIILLAKTPENFLSTSSAKTNHYGFPIGVNSKQRTHLPWRNSPVRVLSETETRLYGSYVSRKGLIELKDRANSLPTHEHIYKNILTAEVPTNIDSVVDRKECPYGNDAAIEFVDNLMNASGIGLKYVVDENKIHPEKG